MKNKKLFGLKMFLGGTLTSVILSISPNLLLENESKLIEQARNQKIQRIEQEKLYQEIRKRDRELMLELEERLTRQRISKDVGNYLEIKSLKFIANSLEVYPKITFDILKKEWRTEITKNPKGLEAAIRRCEEYIPSIKHEFLEEGVPQKYVFLGIVESRCLNLTSNVGAKGVFQHMIRTAKSFGAIINKDYDERLNPLFAGERTGKILGSNYDFHGDRDIALASYNSWGLPLKYSREVKRSEVNLEGYLRFLGKTIKRNPGNKKLLANVDQNLNYLKKNIVLFEILEENYPEFFNIEPRKDTRIIYEVGKPFRYEVQRGDSWKKVAEKFSIVMYGAPPPDRIATNRILRFVKRNSNYRTLHSGQKIIFEGPRSLKGIEYQTRRRDLGGDNRQVLNHWARLPDGAKVLLKRKQY